MGQARRFEETSGDQVIVIRERESVIGLNVAKLGFPGTVH
jgi:hypothetical protein